MLIILVFKYNWIGRVITFKCKRFIFSHSLIYFPIRQNSSSFYNLLCSSYIRKWKHATWSPFSRVRSSDIKRPSDTKRSSLSRLTFLTKRKQWDTDTASPNPPIRHRRLPLPPATLSIMPENAADPPVPGPSNPQTPEPSNPPQAQPHLINRYRLVGS